MPTKYRALEGPLRQFLSDRDIGVNDLAARIGRSRKTVSLAINGHPTVWSTVAKIAHELDVAPDAIFDPILDDTEAVV